MKKKTILVVDDSAPMRILLEAMLGHKYKVFAATDGLVATMWLSNGNMPDMIITDIQMPNIDGWQLAKNLSGNALYSDIPIIVLTGMDLNNNTPIYPNVARVMNKPFDPVRLIEIVDQYLMARQPVSIAG
ncbi:two-component system, chemotaxis family, response regulator CheY [Chitinophaga sp. YR573]|uniref:response regulator n=1 Tax=Chitinophaga sp. YR573 TaxID=1881040 RepID=UPI0008B84A20|nr:response regulator [Chitinophaga sp. YR573]SEW40702.1 two-component system, chemotaxis family, response regulator CheY [Chitinophaga sp. YR573]